RSIPHFGVYLCEIFSNVVKSHPTPKAALIKGSIMTINCKGTLIDLTQPRVMGILNCTPDSFFDGGKYKSEKELLTQTERMLNEGADFIDIGAYSSKPNADFITEEEEVSRMAPVVELVIKHFPEAMISADTFRAAV